METIPKRNCTKVGFIQKPHGINGELVLQFEEQYYETLEEADVLLLEIDGLLVPFFVADEGMRFRTGESLQVKFDWVDHETEAQKYAGISVFVNNKDVIVGEADFDVRMLKGFSLFDQHKVLVGEIKAVNNFSGNLLLEVNHHGREILVPFNEDFLLEIDVDHQVVVLNLPDGLLQLDDE